MKCPAFAGRFRCRIVMDINNIVIRKYENTDLPQMAEIWNEVVEEGNAFPQTDMLDDKSADKFFSSQTYCAVAQDVISGKILGLYILHPNNIGRCCHISNASYAVSSAARGLHIGEKLVKDCVQKAKDNGFGILQFNAVVESNIHAQHLYERLGFVRLGRIPKGFKSKSGEYENIFVYYKEL